MISLLIIDDDAVIRGTLYKLFRGKYRCHTAETTERARFLLDWQRYDVVLTEISMPGLNGVELLGHIRRRQPDALVIIITGMSNQEQAQGLIKMGAFDYLLKPFQLEDVEWSVASAIGYKKGLKSSDRGVTRSTEHPTVTSSKAALTGTASQPVTKRKPRALVVDDAPSVTEMFTVFLNSMGYDAVAAFSAFEALDAARSESFDMVVTDIGMPGMSGYELAEALRALPGYRSVPIVAMTGFSIYDDYKRALAAGFNGYLTKPIDPLALLELIKGLEAQGDLASSDRALSSSP